MKASESLRIIRKTREDYNRIAPHFSDTRYDLWPELRPFCRFVKKGINILDWGCGNGRLILALKGKGIHYYGLDQSAELLKIARKKYAPEIKKGWVNFFSTSQRDKKFRPDFFDVAFLIASFHHLPDARSRMALLKNIYRELKPKGKIIITVWNMKSAWAEGKMKKDWKKIGEDDYLVPWKDPRGRKICDRYYHSFSPKELFDLLADAGFKVLDMGYDEPSPWSDRKSGRNITVVAKK